MPHLAASNLIAQQLNEALANEDDKQTLKGEHLMLSPCACVQRRLESTMPYLAA